MCLYSPRKGVSLYVKCDDTYCCTGEFLDVEGRRDVNSFRNFIPVFTTSVEGPPKEFPATQEGCKGGGGLDLTLELLTSDLSVELDIRYLILVTSLFCLSRV